MSVEKHIKQMKEITDKLALVHEVGHVQRFCPKPRSPHNAKTVGKRGDDDDSSEGIFTAGADLPRMGKWLETA